MRERTSQMEIFAEDTWRQTFRLIPKLPFAFSYQFEDAVGRKSTMQVLDWECGQLTGIASTDGTMSKRLLRKLKTKYLHEFGQRDLHFFLGTTQQFHSVAPNPWVIVGVFAPPFDISWTWASRPEPCLPTPISKTGLWSSPPSAFRGTWLADGAGDGESTCPDGTLPANSLSTPGPGFSRSAQRTVLSASRLRGFARGDSVSGLSLPRSILTMDHTDSRMPIAGSLSVASVASCRTIGSW